MSICAAIPKSRIPPGRNLFGAAWRNKEVVTKVLDAKLLDECFGGHLYQKMKRHALVAYLYNSSCRQRWLSACLLRWVHPQSDLCTSRDPSSLTTSWQGGSSNGLGSSLPIPSSLSRCNNPQPQVIRTSIPLCLSNPTRSTDTVVRQVLLPLARPRKGCILVPRPERVNKDRQPLPFGCRVTPFLLVLPCVYIITNL